MSENQFMEPTDAELTILQILWEQGPSSVKTVNIAMNNEREVGYTTTLKFMQIMCDKGLLGRKSEGRKHIYFVNKSEEETQKLMLTNFVDKAFRGSAMRMVLHALGNQKASRKELDEIKDLISKLENKEEE